MTDTEMIGVDGHAESMRVLETTEFNNAVMALQSLNEEQLMAVRLFAVEHEQHVMLLACETALLQFVQFELD